MKRFSNVLYGLTFIVVAALVAGCAATGEGDSTTGSEQQKENSTETIEFVYWAAAGGEEEGFKNLIAQFEAEHPDIKVDAQQVPPPGESDYYTKVQTRILGEDAPDVFRVQYQKIGEFASEDALADVTDVFAEERESFNPSLVTAVTLDDKLYGLPHHTDTIAVFYNKTYLDQLGIQPPTRLEEAWTWDEMLDVAQRIEDEGLAPYGIAYGWGVDSAYRVLPFFFQNGASLLTRDLSAGNVETPEAVETLAFLKNMFRKHMSEGNSLKGTEDVNLLFTSGKAGLLVSGNWIMPKWEAEMEDEWGVTYMPVKKSAASDLGGNALAIPVNAKHLKAAKKFLAFMGEKENMKTFVEQGLFLPGRTDIEGPFDYQLEDPALMDLFIEQSTTVPEELARTVTLPEFAKLNQALADSLEELFMTDTSPEETSETLNRKLDDILSSH